jgi:hypothetical protein
MGLEKTAQTVYFELSEDRDGSHRTVPDCGAALHHGALAQRSEQLDREASLTLNRLWLSIK